MSFKLGFLRGRSKETLPLIQEPNLLFAGAFIGAFLYFIGLANDLEGGT
jgi:hypothetical protein